VQRQALEVLEVAADAEAAFTGYAAADVLDECADGIGRRLAEELAREVRERKVTQQHAEGQHEREPHLPRRCELSIWCSWCWGGPPPNRRERPLATEPILDLAETHRNLLEPITSQGALASAARLLVAQPCFTRQDILQDDLARALDVGGWG
jgi:hypothetical protein